HLGQPCPSRRASQSSGQVLGTPSASHPLARRRQQRVPPAGPISWADARAPGGLEPPASGSVECDVRPEFLLTWRANCADGAVGGHRRRGVAGVARPESGQSSEPPQPGLGDELAVTDEETRKPSSATGTAAAVAGWSHGHRDVSGGWLRPTVFGAV